MPADLIGCCCDQNQSSLEEGRKLKKLGGFLPNVSLRALGRAQLLPWA